MNVEVVAVDFSKVDHCDGVVAVLDSYATDPRGGGEPLGADVRTRLIPGLRSHPTALAFLALHDTQAVGVAVCFLGFSTFQARSLVNIHDLAVVPGHRGKGIGRKLLASVEAYAASEGCCKLTLEVQDANRPARGLYESFGFSDFVIGEFAGTRFLSKSLS
jgi:GNAT superfamily N-acetyltransferase